MIQHSIWFDDSQYLIEDLHGDFAATRVTEDGTGLYTSLDEHNQVTAGLDTTITDGEIGRVA